MHFPSFCFVLGTSFFLTYVFFGAYGTVKSRYMASLSVRRWWWVFFWCVCVCTAASWCIEVPLYLGKSPRFFFLNEDNCSYKAKCYCPDQHVARRVPWSACAGPLGPCGFCDFPTGLLDFSWTKKKKKEKKRKRKRKKGEIDVWQSGDMLPSGKSWQPVTTVTFNVPSGFLRFWGMEFSS